MEEQAALLLWTIRSIKDLLGFELFWCTKTRSSTIIETANEEDT